VIPLVSRGFLQIHEDHPPDRKEWHLARLVTPPMAGWFLKIAPSVENLVVHMKGHGSGVLAQMLAIAAVSAPNLQNLTITSSHREGVSSAILNSIAFLSQIKTLELTHIGIARGRDVASLQRLSALRSLRVGFQISDRLHTQRSQSP